MTNRTLPQQLADRKAQIEEQSIEIHYLTERVEELATDLELAKEDNARLRRDRSDALNVTSKEGLLASEWVARVGKAERGLKAAKGDNARLRALVERLAVSMQDRGIDNKVVKDALKVLEGEGGTNE